MRIPYPLDWRQDRLPILVREFERVRAALASRVGREVPLLVESAYRTEAYNRRINGAPLSQHVQGRALDLRPPTPALVDDLYETVLQVARSWGAIGAIGRYDGFVHMDVRPTTVLKLWDLRSGL